MSVFNVAYWVDVVSHCGMYRLETGVFVGVDSDNLLLCIGCVDCVVLCLM